MLISYLATKDIKNENMKNLKELTERRLFETPLCDIGKKYMTDKPGFGYTKVYNEIMEDKRNNLIDIFEIGIYFGASLRMWHEFFPNGNVYGIDNGRLLPGAKVLVGGRDGTKINILSEDDVKLLQPNAKVENYWDFTWIENERIKCFVADQRSESQLKDAFKHFKCDTFDFIIDDGQHFQEHQQKSLGMLFPTVKSGGYYIIEDIATQENLVGGHFWGQKKKDASDSTDYIFKEFLNGKKLESRYITESETDYIEENIEDIYLFDDLNKNNSPINGTSKILIIKKR